MRSQGSIDSFRGLDKHDHTCLAFDDFSVFVDKAAEFLSDGIERGLRALYVASGGRDEIAETLSATNLTGRLGSRSLEIEAIDSAYGFGAFDPASQVAKYSAATARALAEGFSGLRVAADATGLIAGGIPLASFVRYEHLVDRFMADHPFSALCAYSTVELREADVLDLACVHPASFGSAAPFHIFALDTDCLAFRGVFDLSTLGLFERVLERVLAPYAGHLLRVDIGCVDFMDHRTLLALSRQADLLDVSINLENASSVVRKTARLLPCSRISLEAVR